MANVFADIDFLQPLTIFEFFCNWMVINCRLTFFLFNGLKKCFFGLPYGKDNMTFPMTKIKWSYVRQWEHDLTYDKDNMILPVTKWTCSSKWQNDLTYDNENKILPMTKIIWPYLAMTKIKWSYVQQWEHDLTYDKDNMIGLYELGSRSLLQCHKCIDCFSTNARQSKFLKKTMKDFVRNYLNWNHFKTWPLKIDAFIFLC